MNVVAGVAAVAMLAMAAVTAVVLRRVAPPAEAHVPAGLVPEPA